MPRRQIERRRRGGAPEGTPGNVTSFKKGNTAAKGRGRPPGRLNNRTQDIVDGIFGAMRYVGRRNARRFIDEAIEAGANDEAYLQYCKDHFHLADDIRWFFVAMAEKDIVRFGMMAGKLLPKELQIDVKNNTSISFEGTPEQVRQRIEDRYRIKLPHNLKLITNPNPPEDTTTINRSEDGETIDAEGIEVSED